MDSTSRPPRLLFLARAFPPAGAVASIRTWNIAKHLARLGWDVTVVTPRPSVWRHVDGVEETEANLKREQIRRILTDYPWRWLDPSNLQCANEGIGWLAGGIGRRLARQLGVDMHIGWSQAADRACAQLTPSDVDVILATGPPVTTFRLARRLADRLGRPYVLDYRDPWTGSPHNAPAAPAAVRSETDLLAGAAAVTIVSSSWAEALDHRFGVGPKLHVVTNGYDPGELADVHAHRFGHFAIVYAGQFYAPKRVISPVMAALEILDEKLGSTAPDWRFHYYGLHGDHVSEEAAKRHVTRVVLHGRVPRAEALSAVRGAGVAVVITSVLDSRSLEDEGIVTGKLFETLGLETPILLIAPRGSDARVMIESAGASQAFTGNDTEGMASFLAEVMLTPQRQKPNASAYSWPSIAKKLDSVLRQVAGRNVPSE